MNEIHTGDRVAITVPAEHPLMTTKWWPVHAEHTGTVTKVFKNGRAAVAVDQLRNRSADGCHTLHIELEHLVSR